MPLPNLLSKICATMLCISRKCTRYGPELVLECESVVARRPWRRYIGNIPRKPQGFGSRASSSKGRWILCRHAGENDRRLLLERVGESGARCVIVTPVMTCGGGTSGLQGRIFLFRALPTGAPTPMASGRGTGHRTRASWYGGSTAQMMGDDACRRSCGGLNRYRRLIFLRKSKARTWSIRQPMTSCGLSRELRMSSWDPSCRLIRVRSGGSPGCSSIRNKNAGFARTRTTWVESFTREIQKRVCEERRRGRGRGRRHPHPAGAHRLRREALQASGRLRTSRGIGLVRRTPQVCMAHLREAQTKIMESCG